MRQQNAYMAETNLCLMFDTCAARTCEACCYKMNQANLYMMVSRLTNHNQPNVGILQCETAYFDYLIATKTANYVNVRTDFNTNLSSANLRQGCLQKKSLKSPLSQSGKQKFIETDIIFGKAISKITMDLILEK